MAYMSAATVPADTPFLGVKRDLTHKPNETYYQWHTLVQPQYRPIPRGPPDGNSGQSAPQYKNYAKVTL